MDQAAVSDARDLKCAYLRGFERQGAGHLRSLSADRSTVHDNTDHTPPPPPPLVLQ